MVQSVFGGPTFGGGVFGGPGGTTVVPNNPLPFVPPAAIPDCPGCTKAAEADPPFIFDVGMGAVGQVADADIGDSFLGDQALGGEMPNFIQAFETTMGGQG